MTSLYNCRTDGSRYRITKFTEHFEVESSYLTDAKTCDCPAGKRPMCRHREMLPKFLQRQHVGDEWFFDFDRGGWVQGWKEPEPITATEVDQRIAEMEMPNNPIAEALVDQTFEILQKNDLIAPSRPAWRRF